MHGVSCRRLTVAIGVAFALLLGTACTTDEPGRPSNLESMVEAANLLKIKNKSFQVWVADSESERRRGLMYVTSEEMAPLANGTERGMWFIFPNDQSAMHGFWMKNTIIPLDIAFVRSDGRIVTIRTMAPRDERHYYAKAPYRYALEVNANTFSRLGIKEGDSVEIPKSLLKTSS
jgi:uncharacterized membrane protein (UPF0127 family)